jgi:hypothetical protein
MTWLAIAITGFVLAVVYFFIFGISHLIDYEASSRGIGFHLFRIFTIFELKYEMIERCETRKLFDFGWLDGKLSTLFLTLTIGGWPRLTRVLLKLKRGPIRYIFLFPKNASEFASEVQRNLDSSSTR